MACRIVVGGQYGSEGKGKVVAYYARRSARPYVVRCGGPNSGHTVHFNGRHVVLRCVPAGIVNPDSLLFLAAGCAIDVNVLFGELATLDFDPKRLVIDPRAVLISDDDRTAEAASVGEIASTGSGVGAALVRRIQRRRVPLAGDSASLKSVFRVEPIAPMLHRHLSVGGEVIVEGTQGFALSLLHGADYPYVTARDTSAAAFASEVGLSPRHVDNVTLVIRTFPIRVGGNSGPLAAEISWSEIAALSDAPCALPEYTSVTGRLRRVAYFDLGAVRRACEYNLPTSIAVMGIDRIDHANSGAVRPDELTARAKAFLTSVEEATNVRADLVGTGFSMDEIIDMTRPSAGLMHGYRAAAHAASRP